MYFRGTLSVDPSSITHVELAKPTKAFGQLVRFMTLGLASEKEERETFTAVGILQKFNRIFASLGITNIVRLAKDGTDYYLDEEGKEDDLKEAMESFAKVASAQANQLVFEKLQLVLEHDDDELVYLIQIEIKRRHKVGEVPIKVFVNGLIKELQSTGQELEEAKSKLTPHFASQNEYDALVNRTRSQFDKFMSGIDQAIRHHMGVDQIFRSQETKIIKPKKPIRSHVPRTTRRNDHTHDNHLHDNHLHDDPIYHGYHGMDDWFFYAWIWSEMCHDNQIQVADCDVIDEAGLVVADVGDEGLPADQIDVLNPAIDHTEPPSVADEPAAMPSLTDVPNTDTPKTDASTGGWFSSFTDSFSGGDDSGGSSCGSSCGGGCGGD